MYSQVTVSKVFGELILLAGMHTVYCLIPFDDTESFFPYLAEPSLLKGLMSGRNAWRRGRE